ncbi:MAG: beta-ketoacyl-ACP reductase [Proteobacteria bacterium]|nr:beta-ketoacyl-ACP reductase [Pseudomonadota bacterium]
MFDLSGKTALITGASGGIGSAIATAMATQGASLVLTGTRQKVLEDLAVTLKKTVTNQSSQSIKVVVADMSDSTKSAPLITAAESGIDILVNNAGITRDNLLLRMSDDEWQAVLAMNLTNAMRLSRAVLRGMMKARWGRIIQISSVVGFTGNPGQANYAATKAGLVGFSKSLAAEVASRNITVNIIAPGFIATPMTEALPEAQKTALLSRIPQARMGTPAEIGAAAVFLASDEAAYLTGASLHINGGMAML